MTTVPTLSPSDQAASELLIECDPENGHLCEACEPPHGTEERYRIGDGVTRRTDRDGRNELAHCECEPCHKAHLIWHNHTMWERGVTRMQTSGVDDEPRRPSWTPPVLSGEWKRFGSCRPGTMVPCPTNLTNSNRHLRRKAEDWSHEGCERCGGSRVVPAQDLFFPARGEDLRPAKRVCEDCLVRRECLIWGAHYEDTGVWGGTGEKARIRFREKHGIKRQNLVEVFAGR